MSILWSISVTDNILIAALTSRADSAGVAISREYVPDEYRAYGRETLDYLEENLARTR